jgi:hypothetical protein
MQLARNRYPLRRDSARLFFGAPLIFCAASASAQSSCPEVQSRVVALDCWTYLPHLDGTEPDPEVARSLRTQPDINDRGQIALSDDNGVYLYDIYPPIPGEHFIRIAQVGQEVESCEPFVTTRLGAFKSLTSLNENGEVAWFAQTCGNPGDVMNCVELPDMGAGCFGQSQVFRGTPTSVTRVTCLLEASFGDHQANFGLEMLEHQSLVAFVAKTANPFLLDGPHDGLQRLWAANALVGTHTLLARTGGAVPGSSPPAVFGACAAPFDPTEFMRSMSGGNTFPFVFEALIHSGACPVPSPSAMIDRLNNNVEFTEPASLGAATICLSSVYADMLKPDIGCASCLPATPEATFAVFFANVVAPGTHCVAGGTGNPNALLERNLDTGATRTLLRTGITYPAIAPRKLFDFAAVDATVANRLIYGPSASPQALGVPRGRAVFAGHLDDETGQAQGAAAIFVSNAAGQLSVLVKEGDVLPPNDFPGVLRYTDAFGPPIINECGQVVFWARYEGVEAECGPGGFSPCGGIFLYDLP